MTDTFRRVLGLLRSGTVADWEALSRELPDFPHGVDDLIQRRWIINAVGDGGSKAAIEWMLEKKAELNFRDEEGYTPVLAAIERKGTDKHEILEMLLRAGASANLKGINDWTPAHLAAARDDVEALKILIRYGADLTVRTDIDDYATPLEEARTLGSSKAVSYLEMSDRAHR
jgi:ankyrin repeat protein